MRYIPYLTFNGDCREAFEFYAKVFDGEIKGMFSHADAPMADEIPKELHGRIMNAYMVADGAELMGADAMPHAGGDVKPAGFCVSIHLDDEAHAKRIFPMLVEISKRHEPGYIEAFRQEFKTNWDLFIADAQEELRQAALEIPVQGGAQARGDVAPER
jgi:PhnB protein